MSMYYNAFRAMNSAIVLAAGGSNTARIKDGFVQARQYIEQCEQRFTRFTEVSELAALNRAAGEWFGASADMFQLLEEAQRLSYETEGLFNPGVLPALKQAGYDRSLDEIRNSPTRSGQVRVAEMQDFRQVQLDPDIKSVLLPAGMQVDLGGIAKGWIAEQATWQLAQVAEACAVSAGGDMFLVNLPKGADSWEIGLENPLEPEQDLAVLHVKPGAVATSSITKRQWRYNGKPQHHLIDPRTGQPAITEWLSVTVWAETGTEAEVYAKVLLIGGSQIGKYLFEQGSSKAFLAVDKGGWISGSDNYHEVFHV